MIDRNGEGIVFGGGADRASSDMIIRNNLITNSKLRDNVESHYNAGEPACRNNVVTNNCISGGAYDDGDGGTSKDPRRLQRPLESHRRSPSTRTPRPATTPSSPNRPARRFWAGQRLRPSSP